MMPIDVPNLISLTYIALCLILFYAAYMGTRVHVIWILVFVSILICFFGDVRSVMLSLSSIFQTLKESYVRLFIQSSKLHPVDKFFTIMNELNSTLQTRLLGTHSSKTIAYGASVFVLIFSLQMSFAKADLNPIERVVLRLMSFPVCSILSLGIYPFFQLVDLFYEARKTQTKMKLLRGIPVYLKPRLGTYFINKELRATGPREGLEVYPNIRVPFTVERLSFLLAGGMGSGKTNWIMGILEQCYERKDRSLVLDVKGDYVEVFGDRKDVIIFGPCDARSPQWNVAVDISTHMEAQQFCESLIPKVDGPNSFFADAARDILTGAIVILQNQKPRRWGFKDVQELLGSEVRLYKLLIEFHPGALQVLGKCTFGVVVDPKTGKEREALETDRASRSVLATIRANVQLIDYLAQAWPYSESGFSIHEWIASERSDPRMVIVQFRERYKKLSEFFAAKVFDLYFKEVLSLPDSHSRRLGCFLDELGFLPQIPSFVSAVRAARSKGLRLFVGVQETGVIESTYRSDGGKEAIVNGFGNKLIGRGETPEYVEYWQRMFGKNVYKRTVITKTFVEGRVQVSRSEGEVEQESLQTGDLLSLSPASLEKGATFFAKFSGCPIVKLTWPITVREKKIPANILPDWLKRDEPLSILDAVRNRIPTEAYVLDARVQDQVLNPLNSSRSNPFDLSDLPDP